LRSLSLRFSLLGAFQNHRLARLGRGSRFERDQSLKPLSWRLSSSLPFSPEPFSPTISSPSLCWRRLMPCSSRPNVSSGRRRLLPCQQHSTCASAWARLLLVAIQTDIWIQPTVSVGHRSCASERRHSSFAGGVLACLLWRQTRFQHPAAWLGVHQFEHRYEASAVQNLRSRRSLFQD